MPLQPGRSGCVWHSVRSSDGDRRGSGASRARHRLYVSVHCHPRTRKAASARRPVRRGRRHRAATGRSRWARTFAAQPAAGAHTCGRCRRGRHDETPSRRRPRRSRPGASPATRVDAARPGRDQRDGHRCAPRGAAAHRRGARPGGRNGPRPAARPQARLRRRARRAAALRLRARSAAAARERARGSRRYRAPRGGAHGDTAGSAHPAERSRAVARPRRASAPVARVATHGVGSGRGGAAAR